MKINLSGSITITGLKVHSEHHHRWEQQNRDLDRDSTTIESIDISNIRFELDATPEEISAMCTNHSVIEHVVNEIVENASEDSESEVADDETPADSSKEKAPVSTCGEIAEKPNKKRFGIFAADELTVNEIVEILKQSGKISNFNKIKDFNENDLRNIDFNNK